MLETVNFAGNEFEIGEGLQDCSRYISQQLAEIMKFDSKNPDKSYTEQILELANYLEEKGFNCVIVKNTFRLKNNPKSPYCLIITNNDPLNVEFSGEEYAKIEEIYNDFQWKNREIVKFLDWTHDPIIVVSGIKKRFTSYKKIEKHPVLMGAMMIGNSDILLSKAVYGEETLKRIQGAFIQEYGDNFLQESFEIFVKNEKRKIDSINRINAEAHQEYEEREKDLNKYEVQEMKVLLKSCYEVYKDNDIRIIIGLDCSGRPLAKMFHELIKRKGEKLPRLHYIDPHLLRKGDGDDFFADYAKILKKEYPYIYGIVKKDAGKVMVIDDQIRSYGGTINSISKLFSAVAGDDLKKFHFQYISGFNGYNALTWWKNKGKYLPIRSNKNLKIPTLKAIKRNIGPKRKQFIKDFEAKLMVIVDEVVVESNN